jgi:hypothetical protein
MIIVLLGLIIGGYFAYRSMYKEWYGYGRDQGPTPKRVAGSLAFSLVGVIIGTILGMIIGMLLGLFGSTGTYEAGRRDLTALKDTTATQGQFFLGSGSIDEVPKYFALVNTDKGLQTQDFDTADSYIHERPGQPEIVTLRHDRGKGFYCLWVAFCDADAHDEYHFYIPPNSVTNTFKVDLE